MKRALVALLIFTLCVTACDEADAQPTNTGAAGQIAADRLAARQDLAAAQTRDAQTARLAAAATANAQATDRARSAAATATEAAFSLALRRAQATETAITQHAQATQTSEAQHAASTATALAQAATATAEQQSADATAVAQRAAATADALAAQATASAREVIAARESTNATADARRAQLEIAQAQASADVAIARERQLSDILTALCSLSSLVLLMAILAALFAFSKFVEARWGNLHTRKVMGGMLVVTGNNQTGYAMRYLPAPANQIVEHMAAAFTEEATLEDETPELVEVQSSAADETLTPLACQVRDTPERRLALRLLRHAMHVAGPQAQFIPTAQALEWSSETRQRAINALKPHVTTRQGRTGGTFVAETHRTLAALYEAVRAGKALPSPTVSSRLPAPQTVMQIESNSLDS